VQCEKKIVSVRLSSNEGNNMKGARQRPPVRLKRPIEQTLIAGALASILSSSAVFAQSQTSPSSSTFGRESDMISRPAPGPAARSIDARMIRTQQRMGKKQTATHDPNPKPPTMEPVQQVEQTPPARPPRHAVMTADERRLLRQHIEEAVRDLYKR
jgi:hypothetical protein